MKVLELENVTRFYRPNTWALSGVSPSLEAGEVVGLVGRNGAGKTTLLRLSLGLVNPNAGQVRVFGLDPFRYDVEVKRQVGFLSDDEWKQGWTKVRALLDLHRLLYPTWDENVAKRFLGNWRGSDRKLSSLSLGERRRLLLTCALAHHPRLLLLDEPANGLDPVVRHEFLEMIVQSLSEDGSAVILSSHHMTELERVATRIVALGEGKKVLDESLDTLKERRGLGLQDLVLDYLKPS